PRHPDGPSPQHHPVPGVTGVLLRQPLAMASRLQREHERAAAGLLPNRTYPSIHPPEHLLAVENEPNNRPRLVLQGRCPAALFETLLASQNQSVLHCWRELAPETAQCSRPPTVARVLLDASRGRHQKPFRK